MFVRPPAIFCWKPRAVGQNSRATIRNVPKSLPLSYAGASRPSLSRSAGCEGLSPACSDLEKLATAFRACTIRRTTQTFGRQRLVRLCVYAIRKSIYRSYYGSMAHSRSKKPKAKAQAALKIKASVPIGKTRSAVPFSSTPTLTQWLTASPAIVTLARLPTKRCDETSSARKCWPRPSPGAFFCRLRRHAAAQQQHGR
jgi:hypothetical protein